MSGEELRECGLAILVSLGVAWVLEGLFLALAELAKAFRWWYR